MLIDTWNDNLCYVNRRFWATTQYNTDYVKGGFKDYKYQ